MIIVFGLRMPRGVLSTNIYIVIVDNQEYDLEKMVSMPVVAEIV